MYGDYPVGSVRRWQGFLMEKKSRSVFLLMKKRRRYEELIQASVFYACRCERCNAWNSALGPGAFIKNKSGTDSWNGA